MKATEKTVRRKPFVKKESQFIKTQFLRSLNFFFFLILWINPKMRLNPEKLLVQSQHNEEKEITVSKSRGNGDL